MGGGRLFGRAAELAVIERALDTGTGGCRALAVRAAPGMGKSTLLEVACERALERGWSVLRCTGVETEMALAYSGVIDLLTPEREAVRKWLPTPQQRALDVVMLQDDPVAELMEPHAVARAFTNALQAISRRAPLAVIIDDAQWLDADSARTLAFAIRRMGEANVAVLTAWRNDAFQETALRTALRSLGARHTSIDLAPLTPDEIEQVLAGHRLSLSRDLLSYVQETAAGHPLYALELARHVIEAGYGAVPPSLTGLLDERLGRLSRDALLVVAAAAQLSVPSRELIRAALGADAASVDSEIDEAIDAQILSEHEGRIRFTHPLLAEAASAKATTSWRRTIHDRLAAVVTDAEQRAVHLSLAHTEANEAVAVAIEAGATRARARAAPEVAVELGAVALRLTPATEIASLRRRRVDGAYSYVAAGRPEAAVALMSAALADEPEGEGRVDLQWRTGMLSFLAGDLQSCVELLEQARAGTSDPEVRSHLSTRLASMCCWANDFPRAAEVAESIEVDRLTGSFRINAEATICIANFAVGRTSTIDPWRTVMDFEQLQPAPPAHEHPISKLVHLLTMTRPPTEVEPLAERAMLRARDSADDVGIAWLGAALAHIQLRTGRWDRAAQAADEALRAGRRAGSGPALVLGLSAAATVAAQCGDSAVATEYATELIDFGTRQPIMFGAEQGHLALGFLAYADGDGATARSEYLQAARSLDQQLPRQVAMPPLRWHLVDVLIDAGDLSAAEQELERLASASNHALAAAVVATGRGRVAALRGDRLTADAAFAQAMAAHQALEWPFEQALTLYRHGCVLRDQRRRSAARQALDAARGAFRALGSDVWERRAAEALAGISGRSPSAPDSLTPAEEAVATLAAAGLTNQEIADRLFVSSKTVASHLSHTYAKLSVRSRTELAGRLRDRPS